MYDLESDSESEWGGGQPGLVQAAWLGESQLVAALQAKLEEVGGKEAEMWAGVDPSPTGALLAIGVRPTSGGLSTDIFVVTRDHAIPLPAFALPSKGNYVECGLALHPKGKQIAFESNDGGDREIFVLSHKGAFDISNHRSADWNPAWSPDGDWIVFESFRSGRRGLYRVHPDTALVRRVATEPEADCWSATWSPDGDWLAYVSNVDGDPELFVSDPGGGRTRQLTDNAIEDLAPAWRPEVRP